MVIIKVCLDGEKQLIKCIFGQIYENSGKFTTAPPKKKKFGPQIRLCARARPQAPREAPGASMPHRTVQEVRAVISGGARGARAPSRFSNPYGEPGTNPPVRASSTGQAPPTFKWNLRPCRKSTIP